MKTSVDKCMGEDCICHVVKRRKALQGMVIKTISGGPSIPPAAPGSMVMQSFMPESVRLAAERERLTLRYRMLERPL